MILRRITEHVKAQNWFAVGLDFLIVVIGVFIGLQVSNWNDERGDRDRETQILLEIATDLQADRVQFSGAINSALSRIAAATYVLEQAPDTALSIWQDDNLFSESGYGGSIEASDQLQAFSFDERIESDRDQLWSAIWTVNSVEPSKTAFDSLINSGELGILRNKKLARGLQKYLDNTGGIAKAQDLTFRPARDSGIDIGHQFGLSVFGGVDEEALIKLASANAHLAAAIQTQLGWSKSHFVLLTVNDNGAAELLEQIEGELGFPLDGNAKEVAP